MKTSSCNAWSGFAAGALLSSLLCVAGAAAAGGPGPAVAVPAPGFAPPEARADKAPKVPAKLVDINSASRAELKTLPGVGDAEADRIIAGRPYLSKAQLVTKNVIATGPYLQLRHHVVAMPKARLKGKA